MLTTDRDILRELTALRERDESGEAVDASFDMLCREIGEAFTRSRWLAADDAVGIMELADFFAVGRSTVTNWSAQRFRNNMPEPFRQLGSGPVYSLAEVVRWWVNWVPSKGAKAGTLPTGIEAEGFREMTKDEG